MHVYGLPSGLPKLKHPEPHTPLPLTAHGESLTGVGLFYAQTQSEMFVYRYQFGESVQLSDIWVSSEYRVAAPLQLLFIWSWITVKLSQLDWINNHNWVGTVFLNNGRGCGRCSAKARGSQEHDKRTNLHAQQPQCTNPWRQHQQDMAIWITINTRLWVMWPHGKTS
jgi:hypothetical protein